MSLVTYARYVTLTGDSTSASATVEANLTDAQAEVERVLGRALEYGTYTEERVVWPGGFCYPKVTPLASVPASATYEIEDERTLSDVSPDWPSAEFEDPTGWTGYAATSGKATVTYTGGWTAGTLPLPLQRVIAFIAYGLTFPAASVALSGASSVSVGDVSVSMGGAPADPVDDLWPGASRTLRQWRWTEDT